MIVDLRCSVCLVDIARAGYCLDGIFYCPECSWTADGSERPGQLAFDFEEAS